jgi:hypothetical protein
MINKILKPQFTEDVELHDFKTVPSDPVDADAVGPKVDVMGSSDCIFEISDAIDRVDVMSRARQDRIIQLNVDLDKLRRMRNTLSEGRTVLTCEMLTMGLAKGAVLHTEAKFKKKLDEVYEAGMAAGKKRQKSIVEGFQAGSKRSGSDRDDATDDSQRMEPPAKAKRVKKEQGNSRKEPRRKVQRAKPVDDEEEDSSESEDSVDQQLKREEEWAANDRKAVVFAKSSKARQLAKWKALEKKVNRTAADFVTTSENTDGEEQADVYEPTVNEYNFVDFNPLTEAEYLLFGAKLKDAVKDGPIPTNNALQGRRVDGTKWNVAGGTINITGIPWGMTEQTTMFPFLSMWGLVPDNLINEIVYAFRPVYHPYSNYFLGQLYIGYVNEDLANLAIEMFDGRLPWGHKLTNRDMRLRVKLADSGDCPRGGKTEQLGGVRGGVHIHTQWTDNTQAQARPSKHDIAEMKRTKPDNS